MSRISRLIRRATGLAPAPPAPVDNGPIPAQALDAIIQRVDEYSMVHESGVRFAAESVVSLINDKVPGDVVECGVWRGGSAFAMLLGQREVFGRVERRLHLLDSFEGLPPVTERDGELAKEWQEGGQPDKFFENCAAVVDELHATLTQMGFADSDYEVVKGWFDDTVPPLAKQLADTGISMLRLDGDWYDSTMVCLRHLEPLVSEGGIIIIDDYYAWDGCARAVHDYLSEHDLPYRIKSLYNNYGAYMVKLKGRKDYEDF